MGRAQRFAQHSGLCETVSQVLAFPCNQFMHQEPGDGAAVCSFAARKGAKWPVFAAVDVNGEAESPVYTFLKASAGDWRDVEWNFGKVGGGLVPWLCFVVCSSLCLGLAHFAAPAPLLAERLHPPRRGQFLVGKDGKVVKRFAPTVPPSKLVKAIEELK